MIKSLRARHAYEPTRWFLAGNENASVFPENSSKQLDGTKEAGRSC